MNWAQAHLRRFRHDTRGTTAIIFSVASVGIVAAIGAGVSYSFLLETRTHHQQALDAAVLAGVIPPEGTSEADRISAATTVYLANIGKVAGRSGAGSTATFDAQNNPSVAGASTGTPTFTVTGTTVSGTVVANIKNVFPIIGDALTAVSVNAVARKAESAPICVLGLNTIDSGSFNQNGNSTFNATNCAAQFNSTNASGLLMQGTPSAHAKAFGVSGGVSGQGFQPKPVTGTSKVSDPFASLQFPPLTTCIDASTRFNKSSVTLDPGTYCGGIDAKAGTTLTLNSGVYIMKDGNFTVQSGSTVTGSEVMIAFTGESGNWPATLNLLGGATMNVTSPSSGYYSGIQFFGARETYSKMGWPAIGGSGNAAASLTYDGVMYFPTQDVWIYGGSTVVGKSPTVAIVTQELWLQDNASLTTSQENSRNIVVPYSVPALQSGATLVR